MRRIGKQLGGLVLAAAITTGLPVWAAHEAQPPGTGPAYQLLGKVALMHEGRVKPLDTVAREEVKQVYGRETIKLLDPREAIDKVVDPDAASRQKDNYAVAKWGPVGAFLGWTVNPEFWDDQPFILVDYLPLRRRIIAPTLVSRLNAIAAKSTTPPGDKGLLEKLALDPELGDARLLSFLKESKLPIEDRRTIAELAIKLGEEHKWLTPRELEEAQISPREGQPAPFFQWAGELQEQQRQYNANPQSAPRLTEVERRAVEVAARLSTYKAYSGEGFRTGDIVLVMPRPSSAKYLAATTQTVKEARQKTSERDLPLFKLDELKALSTFWNDVPLKDRHLPTEDAAFDERYTAWLRDNSVWVPLKVLLKSKPEELVEAGYPDDQVRAFLSSYAALAQAEISSPGQASIEAARDFQAASRALGEAVNPTKYPSVETIDRETHFNAMNPFWQAPFAYGAAVLLLVLSLAFGSIGAKASFLGRLVSSLYLIGIGALGIGILLEIVGFYLRVQISGWAPVTNMYETVIWVALVAAVLSFAFEMIYRPTFFALAGSAVALLGTITAANVPLLDPSIKSLQPVLRSNLWLTIHVLTEVSSYAAFGLAWMLGLIACVCYLTSTYRRSPRLVELAMPLVPGVPLLILGGVGVAACSGLLGPNWSIGGVPGYASSQPAVGSDNLMYAFTTLALLGETITLTALLALAGEGLNRVLWRDVQEAEWKATDGTPDARGRAMQQTATVVKPLSNFVYRAMQVGVLLIAAGTMLGGVWADYSWGRFWGWDPKEVWALITLLIYLIPLHGRFAGWVSTFGLVGLSVACFLSVIMAWYGVNFVLGVGLHSYGFVEGGSQGIMGVIIMGMLGLPFAAGWRRFLGQRQLVDTASVSQSADELDQFQS
jgi:ABC-type transport system involved in cytochrome c biogenesis permease subunit